MDEFIGDDAGASAPMEDVQALADRIARLLDDDDLRESVGATARSKALGHTIDVKARQIWDLIRRELPGRGG